MEFFDVIAKRRSVRKFTQQNVSDDIIERALEAAVIAPNSSNTQTWDFHWIKSPSMKERLAPICLSQSAAKSANQFMVVTCRSSLWRRSQKYILAEAIKQNAHPSMISYYRRLVPFFYSSFCNLLAPIKFLLFYGTGLFRPFMRGPITSSGVQEVAVKSAALACENFVLALTAQGVSSCMMEGFDEWRLRRCLNLNWQTKVVMVIAIGYAAEGGLWGPQFRIPMNEVIHKY